MKKKVAYAMFTVCITVAAFIAGYNTAEEKTVPEETEVLEVVPEIFNHDYLDLTRVSDYEITDSGLMLYTYDGNEYWFTHDGE